MSLQNRTEKMTSDLSNLSEQYVGFLKATITRANRMASLLLERPSEDLEDWMNAAPIEERMSLFEGHRLQGESLNAAAAIAELVLDLGVGSAGRVDTRPVSEKLEESYRRLELGPDGKFFIVALPQPVVPDVEDSVGES